MKRVGPLAFAQQIQVVTLRNEMTICIILVGQGNLSHYFLTSVKNNFTNIKTTMGIMLLVLEII